jgi:hypothetical protein
MKMPAEVLEAMRSTVHVRPSIGYDGENSAEGLDVFLNDNLWLATAFALSLLLAIFALLFFLAWLEQPHTRRAPRGRGLRSVSATRVRD